MSSSVMSIDTNQMIHSFTAAGIPDVQAGAVAAAIAGTSERHQALLTETLCSKTELTGVEVRLTGEIRALDTRLTKQTNEVETRFAEEIRAVETRSTKQINEAETRLTNQINEAEKRLTEQICSLETRMTAEVSKMVTKAELSDAITRSKNEIILWVVGSIILTQILPNFLQRLGLI